MTRLLALALAFSPGLCAGEVSVRVLELFRPRRVTLSAPPGRRVFLESAAGRVALEGSQSAEISLTDVPVVTEAEAVQVRIGDQIERTFPGRLTIDADGAELRLIAAMPLEEAVAAIVAAEAGAEAPLEAGKAQAIASRSYLLATRGRHEGYRFCDTTHCQHLTEADAASRGAAVATAGMVLRHGGAVVEALSTRRCGGSTRTLADIGLKGEGYSYFPVGCEPCRRKPLPWKRAWPAGQVSALVESPGWEAARLEVVRRLGWSAVPSNAYALRMEGAIVELSGQGEGHGVGLCQYGSAELARRGWDARRILELYFVNAIVGR